LSRPIVPLSLNPKVTVTLLTRTEDKHDGIQWLFDTHLEPFRNLLPFNYFTTDVVAAILHGNDDCPTRIELYRKNHHRAKPFAVFVLLPNLCYALTASHRRAA